jgi:hypothetical protein
MSIENPLQKMTDFFIGLLGPRGVALCVSVMSTIYDVTYEFAKLNYRALKAFVYEFTTIGNLWVFRDDNSLPIPYKVFKTHPENIKWFYNTLSNNLYESINYITDRCAHPNNQSVKLPWRMSVLSQVKKDLSKNEVVIQEYFLDDWASNLFMNVYDAVTIPPNIITQCWSLNSGVWLWSDADTFWRLQIIDRNGENITFDNVTEQFNEEDQLKWRRVLGLESSPQPAADDTEYFSDEDEGDEDNEQDEQDNADADADASADDSHPHAD